MQLYLIRHAQSTNNALSDPSGRVCDPPLTELGRQQSQMLAHYLANGVERVPGFNGNGLRPTRLLCSPMQRALETAWPAAGVLGLAPEVWVELHEYGGIYLDHGDPVGIVGYPGKTRSEILAEFPGCVVPESITDKGWWRGGREDREACDRRAGLVASVLCHWADRDERVALISHGDLLDALIKALLGTPCDRQRRYSHHNTGISRIELRPDGQTRVYYLNRLDHLPPDLIS